jgi:hypothetical protein
VTGDVFALDATAESAKLDLVRKNEPPIECSRRFLAHCTCGVF